MTDEYKDEKSGQLDFYNTFLPRINNNLKIEDIISDNNDGVINGNLLEFKLHITNLDIVLFQCIKYLSSLRIKGKPVPSNILIIDLNAHLVWKYNSANYLSFIEQVYIGGASKNNNDFIGDVPNQILDYNKGINAEKLISILKENNFTKIHIDENCIVGWATSFYKKVPTARKEDFIGDNTGKHNTIGEIRNPVHFKNYIYPYTGETNIKFNYLMDKLNDILQKKELGAYYTPKLYAQKSIELVRKAIKRVPKGNDYVIIDRCAGTGNLEAELTTEELGHCIVSTIEYYEYKVLQELIGDKVLHMIPPKEEKDTFNAGLVQGSNALTEEYLENPIIKQYLEDPKYTIILFENPPYSEPTSIEYHKKNASRKASYYVINEMKKETKGATSNDIGNVFIWSAFKYYLRQPSDSYIVFSPVKYWKAQHLVSKKFICGYGFNRKHFHGNTDACIMCALWANIEDRTTSQINLEGFDIKNDELLPIKTLLPVKKINTLFSEKYYDKTKHNTDITNGILVGLKGLEAPSNVKHRIKPKYSPTILGYMVADSSGFENPDTHSSLLVAGRYNGNGFYLRKNNYLEKLPMFCASRYITYNSEWTERSRIMKSADGAESFYKDVNDGKLTNFLLKCLLFTCIESQNHMRSFTGSDGRFYRNELCLDTTNGETVASIDIAKLNKNIRETTIIKQWNKILKYAKSTQNYNSALTYGIYQISVELDTSHKDEYGNTIYDYKELHTAIQGLKILTKSYFNSEIVPTLFKYEFLK